MIYYILAYFEPVHKFRATAERPFVVDDIVIGMEGS